ncbi:MAG: flavin reductase family protein [Deferrisomatales bacterium]|nr:flavin reductase family protein [Deferrisomatales bacterium]
MQADPSHMSLPENHRMLSNLVFPRPIALVTTVNAGGLVNVAPFSFFGVVCAKPPMLGISLGKRNGREKDTLANARATGELVVNLTTESMAERINLAAMDFPPDHSELAACGFTPVPARRVRPPRIAESPAHMECRVAQVMDLGGKHGSHSFLVAEVVLFHVRDELFSEGTPKSRDLKLLGRAGNDDYFGLGDRGRFEMKRLQYEEWSKGREPPPG